VQEQLLPEDFRPPQQVSILAVQEPYSAFLDTLPLFYEEPSSKPGISPSAHVDPTACIDPTASIGPLCVIGANVTIGARCVVHANVTLGDSCCIGESTVLHSGVVVGEYSVLGSHCTVHCNSVIGADGFGYIPDKKRGLRKVPQVGSVVIGNDVEIGANSCIDRGAIGTTVIGPGTKIDNLVQIGHNVKIGSFCIICGQVGIAGSTTIEDGVVLGGQVGVADHLVICKGVRIGGGSSVTEKILEPGDYIGYPLMKARDWQRRTVELHRSARRRATSDSPSGGVE
jgi:UDP-3-O-[3-hydroxymyristoyl] glucosamine N-acyltransferase